jgi:hypothetical protein
LRRTVLKGTSIKPKKQSRKVTFSFTGIYSNSQPEFCIGTAGNGEQANVLPHCQGQHCHLAGVSYSVSLRNATYQLQGRNIPFSTPFADCRLVDLAYQIVVANCLHLVDVKTFNNIIEETVQRIHDVDGDESIGSSRQDFSKAIYVTELDDRRDIGLR